MHMKAPSVLMDMCPWYVQPRQKVRSQRAPSALFGDAKTNANVQLCGGTGVLLRRQKAGRGGQKGWCCLWQPTPPTHPHPSPLVFVTTTPDQTNNV